MIALALLMQSALPPGSPPGISMSVEPQTDPTPVSETQDIGILNCRLTGDDGRIFTMLLEDGGGRGYRDPRTNEVAVTESEVRVTSTPAELFGDYEFKSAMHGGEPGYKGWAKSKNAPLGGTVDVKLSRVTPPLQQSGERRAIIIDGHWQWLALTRAVGFCDLKRIPQKPLSDAETRKYLRT